MRPITYYILMIGCELPGDGVVRFYKSQHSLSRAYNKIVDPMLAVCESEGLEEDVDYSFVHHFDNGCRLTGVRFEAQQNDKLDELMPLGSGVNNYIQMTTISVPRNYTHYLVTFSQYVDESSITLHTLEGARARYERTLTNAVSGTGIVIADNSTWVVDGEDVFRENKQRTEFFDTNGDPYTCTRLRKIPKVN